jgi:hypothetical protein
VGVILALTGAVALATPVPSPPQVAEIAPATQQVENDDSEEPEPLTDDLDGDDPYAAIDRSAVRRCVGNPPRQTEDPMSPPCVAYWDGDDNGGATAKGVTAEQINIVMPGGIGFLLKGPGALIDYFNSRYEFYGRQLNLQYLPTGEFLEGLNPSQYAAYAEQIDAELDAFAILAPETTDGSAGTLLNLVAERGIMAIDVGSTFRTSEDLVGGDDAIFHWSWHMTDDVRQQNVAEWVCKNLVGNPAIHSGDEHKDDIRQFGILVQRSSVGGESMDASVLIAALQQCDAPIAATQEVNYELGGDPVVPGAQTVLARLRSEGVTSILCVCINQAFAQGLMPAAEELGWHPEWVSTATTSQADSANLTYFWPPAQRANFFGPKNNSKTVPFSDAPWFQAIREADPTITTQYQFNSHENESRSVEKMYQGLLMLATGIQGAGPNLTPETFAQAMYDAEFPNPGAGGPPLYQGEVGFDVGDHSFMQDLALVYWDDDTRAIDDPRPGSFCYVNSGERYGLGEWPEDTDSSFYTEGRPADVSCR